MKLSKNEIKDLQKSLFLNMKKKVLSYEGEVSEELKSYRQAQKRYANRPFKISNLLELFENIERSDLVFLGDFHTFDQNSKNFERILKNLIKKDQNLVFGLELIFTNKQKYIDLYLEGHLSELEFLESIDYFQSWKFPWKHYSFLFNFAKSNNLKILALNSHGTLDQRDQTASNYIVSFLKNYPGHKMLVLFGELHIMPNKIPRLVANTLGNEFKQLIIHQNLDDIFWKLNDSSIIKFNDFEFSLQVSPPWIKYESLIYWLENIMDDPEFDLHEYLLEQKGNLNSGDLSEKFLFLCLKINEGLGLNIERVHLESFNIFDYHQMEIVLEKLDHIEDQDFYHKLISRGKSFNIPKSFDYYLPNISVNKVSMIVGLHLKNILSENISDTDIFCRYIGDFFIAHFCSKMLNPYKKCDLYLDLKKKINSIRHTQEEKELFKISISVLNDISNNIDISNTIRTLDLYKIYAMAEIIGPLLGDIYYQKIDSYDDEVKGYIQEKLLFSNPKYSELTEILKLIFDDLRLNELQKDFF